MVGRKSFDVVGITVVVGSYSEMIFWHGIWFGYEYMKYMTASMHGWIGSKVHCAEMCFLFVLV